MKHNEDADIPLLTDMVEEPVEEPVDETLKKSGKALPGIDLEGAERPLREPEEWQEQDWKILERRLSERILHQLQGRVDFVLEQRIKECMTDVLTSALADLTLEIGKGLQQTLEKIVSRAVSQELAHLQTQSATKK